MNGALGFPLTSRIMAGAGGGFSVTVPFVNTLRCGWEYWRRVGEGNKKPGRRDLDNKV